jgi:hypothetical protein
MSEFTTKIDAVQIDDKDATLFNSGAARLVRISRWVWTYEPQPDITAYELARLLPFIMTPREWLQPEHLESLEPEVRRHIKAGWETT